MANITPFFMLLFHLLIILEVEGEEQERTKLKNTLLCESAWCLKTYLLFGRTAAAASLQLFLEKHLYASENDLRHMFISHFWRVTTAHNFHAWKLTCQLWIFEISFFFFVSFAFLNIFWVELYTRFVTYLKQY